MKLGLGEVRLQRCQATKASKRDAARRRPVMGKTDTAEELPRATSPNEDLARLVSGELVARGLIPASRRSQVERGLADGGLKREQWRLFAELAITEAETKE
jgi:hypothetical protein